MQTNLIILFTDAFSDELEKISNKIYNITSSLYLVLLCFVVCLSVPVRRISGVSELAETYYVLSETVNSTHTLT